MTVRNGHKLGFYQSLNEPVNYRFLIHEPKPARADMPPWPVAPIGVLIVGVRRIYTGQFVYFDLVRRLFCIDLGRLR